MQSAPEAIIYCEGAYQNTYGKTAHGLMRRSKRFSIRAVIDSTASPADAGELLDGIKNSIPVVNSLSQAQQYLSTNVERYLVIGLATDGGVLPATAHPVIRSAITAGMHVICGLHDYLQEQQEFLELALKHDVKLVDVRKPPHPKNLHFFSGKISEVQSKKVAVLGTDSAIGKRTTAWKIVEGLEASGRKAELIGTGQTAWLQGAKFSIVLDALPNDFVTGELEHAAWLAWNEMKPDYLVVEGQGSLLHPAFPGGFEILAAIKPDFIILQHAPKRTEYDGFPYRLHSLKQQIDALEAIAEKKVTAITINHEKMTKAEVEAWAKTTENELKIPCIDMLWMNPQSILKLL
ncbi:DUF1611 domain-containing protein [bacterium]|nr:DUF1611 domain-containing protein [bacterium]